MKLVRWRRFTWDLAKLPPVSAPLPDHYHLRAAEREEQKTVLNLVFSAFSLDTSWSDVFGTFRDRIEMEIAQSFDRESIPAVVLTHGQRIIAASAIDTDHQSESNLISGPCVLVEYRNRGLGTALLHLTLKQLQAAGIGRASGICKELAPATKFVYPKFGSTNVAYDFEPSLVGN